MKFTRLRKSEMYERIFNTLAVLTIGGIGFIAWSLPKVFETSEEIRTDKANISIPQMEVSIPNVKQTIRDKVVDDAIGHVTDAMALIEYTTSVKEPRHIELPKLTYVGNFYITMYAATVEQCGNSLGITASGKKVTEDPTCWTVAVDPKVIPLGTKLKIDLPGYENIVFEAADTGGDIKNYWIDVFTESEPLSKTFNPTYADVWIVEE